MLSYFCAIMVHAFTDCEAACVRRTLENIRQIDNGHRESNDRELVNDEISNNIHSSNQPEKLERQENGNELSYVSL